MNAKDQVVVISGSTGYVGQAVAKRFAEQGMRVALMYSSSKDAAEKLRASLAHTGHHLYQCDIQNEQAVKGCIEQVEKEMGPITIALHAAGLKLTRKPLLATTTQELEEQLAVNTVGSFHFLTACGRVMKEHKHGVLIGITTIGVDVPSATKSLGAYVPAKFALQGMLTMLKEELASSGVRVYSIAPGFMPEGMNADIPRAFVHILRSKSPSGTLASAEDVAEKMLYLCSEDGKSETQLTIRIAPEQDT